MATILAPDDLNKEMLVTVHSIKGSDEHMPLMGQAFVVKAVERPFVVLHHYATKQVIPALDERIFQFMKVSQEFADAQVDTRPQKEHPMMAFFGK